MKIHDVEQGSPEWLTLRLGIPTASMFDKVVTPKGKLSESSRDYAHRLIAERVLGRSLDSLDHLEWVVRGKELEPAAARMYAFEQGVETREVGFVTSDDGRMGASPDRLLVGQAGILEIKCPAPNTHVGYMLEGFGTKYFVQVQGQLLVTAAEFADRYSYHPDMPPVLNRTNRDEAFIRTLADALEEFNDGLEEKLERVRALGAFDTSRPVSPVDAAYDPISEQVEYFQ
jgi:hypothetical protein